MKRKPPHAMTYGGGSFGQAQQQFLISPAPLFVQVSSRARIKDAEVLSTTKDDFSSATASTIDGFNRADAIRFLIEHIADLAAPDGAAVPVILKDGSAVFIAAEAARAMAAAAPAGGCA
jgi:hypothetical protein